MAMLQPEVANQMFVAVLVAIVVSYTTAAADAMCLCRLASLPSGRISATTPSPASRSS